MTVLTKNSFIAILITLLSVASCAKNEVTIVEINKSAIALNVGQSDSIQTTITFTGDINSLPITWSGNDTRIATVKEGAANTDANGNSSEKSTKTIVITAVSAGTTVITIQSGNKTATCQVTVNQTNYSFNNVIASNWGDLYDTGNNSFDMYLLQNTLAITDSGKINGVGTFLYLDFNVPITQSSMSPGKFTVAGNGDVGTFFPGEVYQNEIYGTRIVSIGNDSITITLVKDGQYEITQNGSNFMVEGNLITGTNEVVHFSYSGTIPVADKREQPVEIAPAFTKGRLYYFGDAYSSKISNNFVAYLATKDVNFNDSVLNGEVLMLEINTALTATDYIPNGTYNMITYSNQSLDLSSPSLVFGYTSSKTNQQWGCWYYGKTNKSLRTGNITVNKTGNDYNINYQLYDRIGSKIYGSFTGPLEYFDATQKSGAPKAKIKSSIATKNILDIQKRMYKPKTLRYRI